MYYYLVSSLPFLHLGEPPPLSSEAFLALCEQHLPASEYVALVGIGKAPREVACCEVERRWNAWETYLRNCTVRHRAVQRREEPDRWLRPNLDEFAELERQVMDAMDDRNPMHGRRHLDRLRWQRLDDLAAGHDFDFEVLVIYRIKLQMLEKWSGLDAEDGRVRLAEIVTQNLHSLES